ncbi:molybdenum cofactor guanylyltransferase [Pseudidiomarina terrestris]|uniref:Molybdenum cofactor guanylyltransferase n=1 Tax=Pseudidiomarina terrestris TaxID=2820060 RepID=A0AAW7R0E8_9GAMM|nr:MULTISPECIES: molybdenum cofactor guanylyltransferase [unclassified Pseudidiomarina]MDN7124734.1 molybdenum cofactor guanylyltransferase [Pseudidiomarina sp. 1APP75-32.1]MDN7129792.1 molybdenum cofactor guanylyltransferase [Pseudidiomarina sp. 1APR75-15]MDN7136431.1 molybdenum cofactor guanylyltransferase [Pseudidiomarina sp. 1ASP75-5]MDN7137951.1 molybdenum cofactor guanylyltransferase [Pseudidiomarina sp. 1ASP75-14]MEA3588279.1 molybdenum cofactor guanylyltransferase [Pseudidiomarina sp. 
MAITAVILAGGASRRMGQDKALMQVAGRTQLDRMSALAHEAGCEQVLISRNGEGFIADEIADRGPLGGVLSALPHCLYETLLLLPVDMPLLSADALQLLVEQAGPAYFINSAMPCVLKNEPALRVYLTEQLCDDAGDRSVRGVLNWSGAAAIAWPYDYQLQNTNTPQQWQRALTFLGEQ